MYRHRFSFLLFASLLCTLSQANAAESFRVFPESIELSGKGATTAILVQGTDGGDVALANLANFEAAIIGTPVARLDGNELTAVEDGDCVLEVRVPGFEQTARIPVQVRLAETKKPWQFDAHVQSVLSRAGCNSGACHGALAGKGGFRLSLRGYDSKADHYTITRQDRGRRVEPADPGRSLLLVKPTGAIAHKGGLRLEQDSDDYRLLAEWIADGAPGPTKTAAKLERIEVLPGLLKLEKNTKQPLLVRAHYEDGRIEDVTRWAKFSSANEVVAQVDDDGNVSVIGNGKGAIVVWFASRIAISSIISPYAQEPNQLAYRDFKPNNLVDEILLQEWQALNLTPSPTCSDETFIRRAYLDTTGTLPTPDQVKQFIGDTDQDRRAKLVEQLLASEAYVDYWAYQWS
ncbi:MAG: DUF1549 domain-containing protein, partial [Planctomycetota bacterium]